MPAGVWLKAPHFVRDRVWSVASRGGQKDRVVIVIRHVVAVAVNRPEHILLELVRMPVFRDHLQMTLYRLEYYGAVLGFRLCGPQEKAGEQQDKY